MIVTGRPAMAMHDPVVVNMHAQQGAQQNKEQCCDQQFARYFAPESHPTYTYGYHTNSGH